ncbi:hypothetical protein I6G41_08375 [Staphylococcus equorum]|uniref:hypothetical protein n=1 Tax=Staphylococcus equorum TaxID=246432 RepID=UPI0018D8A76A|nr:hypothetical protein [Staphylococcus equorum]QPS98527.1 hypothetical protein I6G41_08375 [Staphylococcus equorum]
MSPEEETTIHRSTMKLMDKLYKALKQRDQYKAERDTLIDDLSWYKAKVSRLERHNKDLRLQSDTYFEQWQGVKKELQDYEDDYEMVTTNCIYWEDKAHWLEDEKGDYKAKYIIAKLHLKDVKDENILKNNLLSEFSEHIGNKPSSSTYKYFRAKLDNLNITEDE